MSLHIPLLVIDSQGVSFYLTAILVSDMQYPECDETIKCSADLDDHMPIKTELC